jgi:hypothetical protein
MFTCRTVQVRGVLHRHGFKAKRARPSHPLTDDNKAARIAFCNQHRDKTAEWWRSVVFADESSINTNESGSVQLWVSSQTDVNADQTKRHSTHPPKLHMWGAIGGGMSVRVTFPENMTGKSLATFVRTQLVPLFRDVAPGRQWNLLQDNAPTHKSVAMQTALHNAGIVAFDFPPYSPDLNPIENVWSKVKHAVGKRNVTNLTELEGAMQLEFDQINKQTINNLADSMPDRIAAVLAVHGARIHY